MRALSSAWLEHQDKRWIKPDADRFFEPQRRERRARLRSTGLDDQREAREEFALGLERLRLQHLKLKCALAQFEFSERLRRLERKNWEDQPRAPAGSAEGGQWTEGGGSGKDEFQQEVESAVDKIFDDVSDWSFTEYDFGDAAVQESGAESTPTSEITDWSFLQHDFGVGDLSHLEEPGAETGEMADAKPPGVGHNQGPPLNEPPTSPVDDEPSSPADKSTKRTQVVRAIARGLVQFGAPGAVAAAAINIIDSGLSQREQAEIESYKDPPRTLEELQPGRIDQLGYQRHHINEEAAARKAGDLETKIQSRDNTAKVPTLKHEEITGWFQTKNPEFGGLSPRNYLVGKSWDERRRVGLYALEKFKVLRP